MVKGKFSVIIVPHDIRKTRTFRVPYGVFYSILALAAVGLAVVLFFVATYGVMLIRTREFRLYKLQVEELAKRQEHMAELQRNLAELRAMNVQVRHMLGLDLPARDSLAIAAIERASGDGAQDLRREQAAMLLAIPTFWPVRGFITKRFEGPGSAGAQALHGGIDIAVERGTPVRAAAAGYVAEAGWSDDYGYFVQIDHGYSIKTLYGHADMLVVVTGERVTQGQTIAYSGNTGKSTAPHLHFQVMQNNVPVDPLKYLLQ
jgi:murein DD-endopeptidase MepM/ murein hydrolase activator NlpD